MIFKYRKYAEALYEALREDAFYATMEQSIEAGDLSKEAMLRYMEFSMIEAEKSGELFIPREHDYGVSVWAKPISKEIEVNRQREKKLFLLSQMGEKSAKTYKAIVEYMSAKSAPLVGRNFWYLSILGILPEFQGQGLGEGLLNDVLRKTDTAGTATYLETFTPRNIPFYKRLGYQIAESFREPTTQSDYWLMIREPFAV